MFNQIRASFWATTSKITQGQGRIVFRKRVTIIKADGSDDDSIPGVNLVKLMDELYKREIDSVLLEGGGTLNASALKCGIVDKIMKLYIT